MERPLSVAVSAVRNGNKVLLIKRNRGDYQGYWALPGGKIEKNEHLHHAVKREIREESGIEAKFEKHLGTVSEHLVENEEVSKHFLLHVCQLSPQETEVKPTEEGDLKWFDLSDFEDFRSKMIPSDAAMLEKIIIPERKGYYNCIIENEKGEHNLTKFELIDQR